MIAIKKDDFEWREGLTVEGLLESLKARGKYRDAIGALGVIVVVNGKIVTTDQYSMRTVGENDMIHLMSFVSGG